MPVAQPALFGQHEQIAFDLAGRIDHGACGIDPDARHHQRHHQPDQHQHSERKAALAHPYRDRQHQRAPDREIKRIGSDQSEHRQPSLAAGEREQGKGSEGQQE